MFLRNISSMFYERGRKLIMNIKCILQDLKEGLIDLQYTILDNLNKSRDYEFNPNLEEHDVALTNTFRLHYLDYYRVGEEYRISTNNIGVLEWVSKPFQFPEGMSFEEGFKVLSYLTDFIEKRSDVDVCSLTSVRILSSVLQLDRFGFKQVKEIDDSDITDLFTINGRISLFKNSEFYPNYFEWYKKGVSKKEVISIYKKYDMEFKDIIWIDRFPNNIKLRTLKK